MVRGRLTARELATPIVNAASASFFFGAASLLADRTFLLGGSDWDDVEVPANVRAIGHVYTAEHNGLYAGARSALALAV